MKRLFLTALLAGLPLAPASALASAGSPYILVNLDSGLVLAERNANQFWYPASVTKIMTAYVTFRALAAGKVTLASPVTVSATALAEPPSKMGYKVGTVMTLDNALKMLIVHSANDIAVAIAETIGGTKPKFIDMMNAEAERLGMVNTHFSTPNGLPDDRNVTTARDMAVLARAVWREFPEHHALFGITGIRVGKRVLRSQNALLERYQGTNGMKTGFICASGFNMVATASRHDRTLMAVVFGETSSKDRAEQAARLLNKGFSSWGFFQQKQDLDSFRSPSPTPQPANMRDIVCGPHRQVNAEDGDTAPDEATAPLLGPPIRIMEPVKVWTGLTEPGEKPSKAKVAATPGDKPAPERPAKPTKAMAATAPSAKPETGDNAKKAAAGAALLPAPRPKRPAAQPAAVETAPPAKPAAAAPRPRAIPKPAADIQGALPPEPSATVQAASAPPAATSPVAAGDSRFSAWTFSGQ